MIVKEYELKTGDLPINKVILGNALNVLKNFPDNSIDAVVTDPPYGLHFMNQKWDYDVPSVELWRVVLRVLKPGGHLLSFFGTRTYHRGVVNIEDAGFEIRDMIVWLYGSGFSKGMDISKAIDKELGAYDMRKVIGFKDYTNQDIRGNAYNSLEAIQRERLRLPITAPATPEAKQWQGWNTSLKPACEPIVLARKPLSEKNIAQNVLKWGTGGLNIDGCRIPFKSEEDYKSAIFGKQTDIRGNKYGINRPSMGHIYRENVEPNPLGRYPANVILDEEAAKMLDEQTGIVKRNNKVYSGYENKFDNAIFNFGNGAKDRIRVFADSGGASRYLYCAKAGRDERFAYCQDCDEVIPQKEWSKHKDHKVIFHTTVKPLKLMEYLVRLVTPPDGIVLDPFFGTGTTGIACLKQGFRFIGIEIDPIYCKIAEHRLKPYVKQKTLLEFP